ncbi:MAG TPA: CYTH domain-containing protein [Candidatus Paceibacterota bacterium]|jgi:adenylate cyclase class IV
MSAAEQLEIEIKCLLGDEQAAHDFRNKLAAEFPGVGASLREKQLNHYFEGGDLATLAERIAPRLTGNDRANLARIVERAASASVRTREVDGLARFVVKASLGDDSSENGVVRVEVDAPVEGMTLDELDTEILEAGYAYQAKWSRAREVYEVPGVTVCIDRNAGYGYLVEFEKVIDDPAEVEASRAELEEVMRLLGVEELPQDRLERMFKHYNEHWPEYYGTTKVFIIE